MGNENLPEQNKTVEINIQDIIRKAELMFKDKFPIDVSVDSLQSNAEIMEYWYKIDNDTSKRYWGHGVNNNSDLDQLIATMSIAKTKVITGSTAPFGSGYHDPYLNGSSLVISKIDQELFEPEHTYVEITDDSGRRKGGYKSQIGAIVLNTRLYPFYEDLKAMYPDVTIIKASELTKHVLTESGKQG